MATGTIVSGKTTAPGAGNDSAVWLSSETTGEVVGVSPGDSDSTYRVAVIGGSTLKAYRRSWNNSGTKVFKWHDKASSFDKAKSFMIPDKGTATVDLRFS